MANELMIPPKKRTTRKTCTIFKHFNPFEPNFFNINLPIILLV